MPTRFAFRQLYYKDISIFLHDGEIRSKNHRHGQRCHQTSYPEIVERRGTNQFEMPCGGVVNDYVPFYFSPLTAFSYTISRGNVHLRCPDGTDLGIAREDDRVFVVSRIADFAGSDAFCCYSDFALNSQAPIPSVETDLAKLENHVHWDVFDEAPIRGRVSEIGYEGVCQYFNNRDIPEKYQLRKQKRMAEFLVREAVPLHQIVCIIAKSETVKHKLRGMMNSSKWEIPVYVKPGCYF